MADANPSGTLPGRRFERTLEALTDLGVRPVRVAFQTARRLLAFALIVLATTVTKFGRARAVVHPIIWGQVRRAGVGLLPFVGLISVVVGVVFVGQTVSLLRQLGAADMLGPVLVVTLFRELAPLATAFLVLLRVGTATVVELAMLRATGEVEALEALCIDPVHYLVMPRVVGLGVSVFCLSVYFILGALVSGYLFCFVQEVPLAPLEYVNQIARALHAVDFVILVFKTAGFGAAIAVITCYQGLARPLRLEQIPEATTRAVTHAVVFCLLLDVAFLAVYLIG
jgi:phospholipid/cholesterol/gamma-HCH transport system permease protein